MDAVLEVTAEVELPKLKQNRFSRYDIYKFLVFRLFGELLRKIFG